MPGMSLQPDTGVLLINLGTPDAPTEEALRPYLREFLSDPQVLDMPAPLRWLLLHGFILRTRPRTSAAAYARIWTEKGSPLLVHTEELASQLAEELGSSMLVEVGMRYGNPSLELGLERLRERGASKFVAVPLFPQSAEATTGSVLTRLRELTPPHEVMRWVEPFYANPGFAEAWREAAATALADFAPDHVLLSYHGLPEKHIKKADPSGTHCLASAACCLGERGALAAASGCYRAQCYATSQALTSALGLAEDRVSTAFQSRLGRDPWIQPYTDDALPELAAAGVKKLAVLCPAFAVDCLETLEEIGIQAAEQWNALGGESLRLLPCPNATPALAKMLAVLARNPSDLPD